MDTENSSRKLTTILAADVAGYSRLMSESEETTLQTLRAYLAIIRNLVEKHGGRIFNTAGDAVLAEFGSAVEGVRCAVAIQEELAARNTHLPEDRQMWFRIGINVGDVMIEGNDLFGDGVNVAARLEGLAETGGICISGSTFEHVKNKLSVAFSDLGPQKVKNIAEPVTAFRIVPGPVSVKVEKMRGRATARGVFAGNRALAALAAVGLVAAAGLAFWSGGYLPSGNRHDGIWQVTVHPRTGCRNNDASSYSISVVNGVIDEPGHPLPKKGTLTDDGRFTIEVYSRNGARMNTQQGSVSGDAGEGRFVGVRPGCTGKVTLARAG